MGRKLKPHLKPIPGFACYYADDAGNIWSARPSRWGHVAWRCRRPHKGRDGYLDVALIRSSGEKANKPVHVLVATAFLGPRPPGLVVRHLDGSKSNNAATNLAYGTVIENMADARRHGAMVRGERSHLSKLTDDEARQILSMAKRGEPRKDIAHAFGVGVSTVDAIKSGRIRADLQLTVH